MAVRVCSDCSELMQEGFVVDGYKKHIEYYCSDTCLLKNYTEEEYKELHESDLDSAYYTEWYSCEMDSEDYDILMYRLLEEPCAGEIANIMDILNRELPSNYAPQTALYHFVTHLNEYAMNE